MTQFQFDMICKIITNGAPALADELCSALDSFVKSYSALAEEHEQLKAKLEATAATVDESKAE